MRFVYTVVFLICFVAFLLHYAVAGQAVYGDGIDYWVYLHSWYFDNFFCEPTFLLWGFGYTQFSLLLFFLSVTIFLFVVEARKVRGKKIYFFGVYNWTSNACKSAGQSVIFTPILFLINLY